MSRGRVKGIFVLMKQKLSLQLGLILFLLFAALGLHAQSDVALATRKAELRSLSDQLRSRDAFNRLQARDFARSLGIPVRREWPNGQVLELQQFTPGIGPRFYITNNVDAADTISTDEVYPGGSAGLNLDGSGMTVGEWDGGAIFADHPDFTGRITQMDGATAVSGHSTHVAGTLVGAGDWLYSDSRGMAYAAHLNAWDWNSDTAEMALAAANGLLLSNHSYGIAAGWLYIGDQPPDTWWWIGGSDPSDVEDPYFGFYDTETQLWDQIAFDAPYYLIVKAAGNDRNEIGPAPGEEYTVIDQDGNFLFTSTLPRQGDCAPAGYDCLPTTSVAKNILTVGAVDDLLGGYSTFAGPQSVIMADFSGWGPTDDGRIKPDVVGNGIFLFSAWPDYPYYALAAGTSMSTPNITGSMLLLQEHFEDVNGAENFMRAATLKALVIHTANEAGDADGPDFEFGWGLMNTKNAAKVISQDGGMDHIIEGSLADSATDSVEINVSDPDAILKATLVWTDPPGTPVALSLDPTDSMLVNDLDLRISKDATVYLPWVLDPTSPASAATTGDNFRDNVEQVLTGQGGAGSYFVSVSHKGTLSGGTNQDYSLIISQELPPPTSSGLLIDENFSGGLPVSWTIETNPLGMPWAILTPVPGDPRLDNLTGGSGNFAMVDNDYSHRTVTSLLSPAMDLSSVTNAVLRFRSYFYFDTLESINVDVSTDGGANWINTWKHQGFDPFPSTKVIDLSGPAAGQSSFTFRFRFDSEGDIQGNLWQIDDVEFEVFGSAPLPPDPPDPPGSPVPADGAGDLGADTQLTWSAGAGATSHDVYFGINDPLSVIDLQGNQTGTSFDPGLLDYATTYYWRIDEINDDGTTRGDTWSFTTESEPPALPGQASTPAPADGTTNIGLATQLTWSAGSLATSHDVYFGTTAAPPMQGNQPGTSFDPGPLNYGTTYYWKVDEVNGDGTTSGVTWSFSTEQAPLETMHLAGLAGTGIPGSRNRWTASVTIDVEDQGNRPEPGVTVEGGWSNGSNGTSSCVTAGDGSCNISRQNLKGKVDSVRFTVNDLTKSGMVYESADNTVGDTIVVSQTSSDATPGAVDDQYQTDVETPVSGNILSNDDPGDGPAMVNSNTQPSDGVLSLSANGAFTYTPDTAFEGTDSFTYNIVDQDGDISNSATVNVMVSATQPPPPGERSIALRPFKVKGVQHVEVTWSGYSGTTVEIERDGDPVAEYPTFNDGSYEDNIGAKGGGQTYNFRVCESGASNCVSDSVAF